MDFFTSNQDTSLNVQELNFANIQDKVMLDLFELDQESAKTGLITTENQDPIEGEFVTEILFPITWKIEGEHSITDPVSFRFNNVDTITRVLVDWGPDTYSVERS